MQHVVCPRHQSQYILVAGQIAPHKTDSRVVGVFLEFFAVLFAVAQQKNDVEGIFFCVKLQEALISHGSGSARQSNSLFVQTNHPFFANKNYIPT